MAESVVVLGMHRSGTSMVTRIVNVLGVPVCRNEELISARDNPAGHWECRSLVRMNDRILATFGGCWYAPPILRPGWEHTQRANAWIADSAHTFARTHPTAAWVWKDPRNCLTLPLWLRALGSDPVRLLVLRNPGDIVNSLRERNGYAVAHCIALWERYTRAAVALSQSHRTVIAHYDQMMREPDIVSRLAEDLSSLGVAITGDVGRAEKTIRVRDRPDRTIETSYLSHEQQQLVEELDLMNGAHESFDLRLSSLETPSIQQIFDAARPPSYYRAAQAMRGLVPATLRSTFGKFSRHRE